MRVCENGIYRDFTAEEIAAMHEEQRRWEEQVRYQPPTIEELYELLRKEQEKVQFLGLLAAGVDINELMSEEEEDGE